MKENSRQHPLPRFSLQYMPKHMRPSLPVRTQIALWLLWTVVVLALLVLFLHLAGCPTAGMSCPETPPAPRTCSLPPLPRLPPVVDTMTGCPDKMVCFDIENAAKIAARESSLKQWVKEVVVRCGGVRLDAGVDVLDVLDAALKKEPRDASQEEGRRD